MYRLLVSYVVLDVPTSKFGDALRAQVEERLNFFETGAPPSKNADAIRRVLDDLALEDGDEDADEMADAEPILTTLEPTPRKEKKKKRKSEAMDVDEDDEGPSSKKVKLSKEEKKALKRAKKEKKEAKKALADVSVSLFVLFTSLTHITTARGCPQKEEREKGKEEEQGIMNPLVFFVLLDLYLITCIYCLSEESCYIYTMLLLAIQIDTGLQCGV